jgi:hypothetical protein
MWQKQLTLWQYDWEREAAPRVPVSQSTSRCNTSQI